MQARQSLHFRSFNPPTAVGGLKHVLFKAFLFSPKICHNISMIKAILMDCDGPVVKREKYFSLRLSDLGAKIDE